MKDQTDRARELLAILSVQGVANYLGLKECRIELYEWADDRVFYPDGSSKELPKAIGRLFRKVIYRTNDQYTIKVNSIGEVI